MNSKGDEMNTERKPTSTKMIYVIFGVQFLVRFISNVDVAIVVPNDSCNGNDLCIARYSALILERNDDDDVSGKFKLLFYSMLSFFQIYALKHLLYLLK